MGVARSLDGRRHGTASGIALDTTIQWQRRYPDLRLLRQQPQWICIYHTCYPAHIVKVNERIVYNYIPQYNDLPYIFRCLTISQPVEGTFPATPVPGQ